MRYNSFIFRFWQREREGSDSDAGAHGRIEHVQSGAVAHIADFDEATAFMRQCLDDAELVANEDQA